MILLVWLELQKIFKKWRTYIGFIAVGLIVAIVQAALYFTGEQIINTSMRGLENSFVMVGNLFNGYFIAHMILGALIIHIPFLVVLVGGDLLAGEATAGTYRMLLTRPVSRMQVVTSKFIAGWIFVLLLLAWLALLSIGVSLIIFGSGPLLSIGGGGLAIIAQNDLFWRFLCAYAYAFLSMITVISLSTLFSSLVQNAIGPIVATMAIIFVFLILGNIPVGVLQDIKPYLFTSHMIQWNNFFSDSPDYKEVLNSALVLLTYTAGFYGITAVIFVKKDILS